MTRSEEVNYMVIDIGWSDKLIFEMTSENVLAFNRLFRTFNCYEKDWDGDYGVVYSRPDKPLRFNSEIITPQELNLREKNGAIYKARKKEEEIAKAAEKAKALIEEEVSS
jgi:hypothetical protein